MNSKELSEVMSTFEKTHKHMQVTREKRGEAPVGHWYTNGETNKAFVSYLEGYSLGKIIGREEAS